MAEQDEEFIVKFGVFNENLPQKVEDYFHFVKFRWFIDYPVIAGNVLIINGYQPTPHPF